MLTYLTGIRHAMLYSHINLQVNNCYCIIQVPDIHVYNVDISDWDKTRHVVQQIGPVDILVNNAAIITFSPFLQTEKQDLMR